jgi:hypothetical protein
MARRAKAAAPAPVQEFEPPAAGHNRSPEEIEADLDLTDDEWQMRLDYLFAECDRRLDELCDADARFKAGFPIVAAPMDGKPPLGIDKWDDSVMARAANMREKFRALVKTIDSLHTLEKQPILRASKMVDAAKNGRMFRIGHYDSKSKLIRGADAPLNRISDRCTIYATWQDEVRKQQALADAEAARIKAEVAAEVAAETAAPDAFDDAAMAYAEAEEAQRLATARPAERTRVVGVGSVMSLRGTWLFDPVASDLMTLVKAVAEGKADIKYLMFDSVTIGAAVRSEGLRELPGCVIKESLKV